ncbi:MAG: hypothetical protein U0X91_11200 [Spirosomataceae bacterium]
MNTKNLFTFNAVIALLFSLPMMLVPKMVADMYLVNPTLGNEAAWVVMRGYGSLLFALAICLWYIRTASPTRAMKGILLLILIGDIILSIVHIHAILNGVENNQAWGIVLVGVVLAVWSGLLLRKVEFEG